MKHRVVITAIVEEVYDIEAATPIQAQEYAKEFFNPTSSATADPEFGGRTRNSGNNQSVVSAQRLEN